MNATSDNQYKSSVVMPTDFQSFWESTLSQTEKIPLEPRLTKVQLYSSSELEVFDVRYKSYEGLDIAGWYVKPSSAKNALPGILQVPGYAGEPSLPTSIAAKGYAVLSVAPRGKLRSNQVFNPGYPGLLTHNIENRDRYGYRGFYMDALRGYDLLRDLPGVDHQRLGVMGSSQGGALSLLVSSRRSDTVKAASAGCPYLCSIMDATSLTRSYPYEEINDYLRMYPEKRETVRTVLNYYDIHNFVDRITCPIIVNIGLKDDVCPPETGYAVYSAIGSDDKRLYEYDNCAHDAGTGLGHENIVMDFMSKHLK